MEDKYCNWCKKELNDFKVRLAKDKGEGFVNWKVYCFCNYKCLENKLIHGVLE